MRGTVAARAASVVQASGWGTRVLSPSGMKWSAYQMPSQPVDSAWRAISSTSSKDCWGLGQTLKRMSAIMPQRFGYDGPAEEAPR